MPPSSPLRNDQLVSNWLETNWLVSTRTRFWEVSKIALQWPPMSHAFYFAGVDPKSLHKITYGITSELDSTLVRLPPMPTLSSHMSYRVLQADSSFA